MSLPQLPSVKRLTPFITRILGQNPGGFTLQGTNTYLIGGPSTNKRLLVDTGQGEPEYIKLLDEYLKTENLEIGAILLTHWHHDHTGGLKDVLKIAKVPVYKYPSQECPLESDLKYVDLRDNQVLDIFGTQLTILHTPGHTCDHVVLFVNNEEVMLSADNVLGHGTTSYSNYSDYMHSLAKMLAFPGLSRIFPGHGEVIEDGPGKIKEYIDHRLAREKQVLEVVESQGPVSSEFITETLYSQVPPKVQIAAKRGVDQFLIKLTAEGKIRNDQHKYSRI